MVPKDGRRLAKLRQDLVETVEAQTRATEQFLLLRGEEGGGEEEEEGEQWTEERGYGGEGAQ